MLRVGQDEFGDALCHWPSAIMMLLPLRGADRGKELLDSFLRREQLPIQVVVVHIDEHTAEIEYDRVDLHHVTSFASCVATCPEPWQDLPPEQLAVIDRAGIGLVPVRERPVWEMTSPVSLGRCTSPQSCHEVRRARVQNKTLVPASVDASAAQERRYALIDDRSRASDLARSSAPILPIERFSKRS
jgi:hypothetical protein